MRSALSPDRFEFAVFLMLLLSSESAPCLTLAMEQYVVAQLRTALSPLSMPGPAFTSLLNNVLLYQISTKASLSLGLPDARLGSGDPRPP